MISFNIREKIKSIKEREVLSRLKSLLDLQDIIVLMGMRQTGKTSLLFLLIKHLLETIPESNIFYFSLEDALVLDNFNRNQKELEKFINAQEVSKDKLIYIFIDEIQHLDDPTKFLKYYYDNFGNYKFIVTGSSSFELRKKFKDSLAGRKKIVEVHPLSFREFLSFKGSSIDISRAHGSGIASDEAVSLWEEHVIYGGHPKIPGLAATELKREELNDIYSSYLQRDIRDIGNIENVSAYNKLVQLLGAQIGNLVSAKSISDDLELNQITLKRYLFILEKSFALSLLRPFYGNKIKEITKMPKVYFEDVGIRNFAMNDFRDLSLRPDIGALVENFVFNELQKRKKIGEEIFFWRTTKSAKEVDFVWKREEGLLPIEVKYRNISKPEVPAGLQSFILEYGPKKGLVLTRDFAGKSYVGDCEVAFLPVWQF